MRRLLLAALLVPVVAISADWYTNDYVTPTKVDAKPLPPGANASKFIRGSDWNDYVKAPTELLRTQVKSVRADVDAARAEAAQADLEVKDYVSASLASVGAGGGVTPLFWSATGDGVTTRFPIGGATLGLSSTYIVALSGVTQTPYDYSIDTATDEIVFTVAPAAGVPISVRALGHERVVNVPDTSLVTATGSTTARSLAARFADVVNVKDFGAVGNGVADDTAAIQAAINAAQDAGGGVIFLPRGTYKLASGLAISKRGITLRGDAHSVPVYGWPVGQSLAAGTTLVYAGTSGNALTVDATQLASTTGMQVVLEDFLVVGNDAVGGATGGGGIEFKADTAGENYFIQGSVVRNVNVRHTKGDAWTITGTVFLNDFYNVTANFAGGNGLTITSGVSGAPTNNRFWGSMFNDNGGWGVKILAGNHSEQFIHCNISQNATGGLWHDGGVVEIIGTDFELNGGLDVWSVGNQGGLVMTGGRIDPHVSGARGGLGAHTSIQIDASSGGRIDKVMFANFNDAADRLVSFVNGGSLELFDYRQQTVSATAFPTSVWGNIARIPPKEKTQKGSVTFTGSGSGTRTATITFPTAFEFSYEITLVPDTHPAFGVTPATFQVGIDYATQGLTSIGAVASIGGAFEDVAAHYIAIGR